MTRIRLDQVDRVEQGAAVVALIAPRFAVAADWTGSFDVAVRQEAAVVDRIDQLVDPLLDQPMVLQGVGEVLGQAPVLRRGRATEPVPRHAERAAQVVLDSVLFLAIGENVLTGGGGGQLGRGAVLVRGADVEHLVTTRPLEPRMDVRRKHGARQRAQVLDAVDVRQGGGDEDAGHGSGF